MDTEARRQGGVADAAEAASQEDLARVLRRIDARLSRLEQTLEPVHRIATSAPHVLATVTDIVDDRAASLGDAEARLGALVDLVERLSRPRTLASLGKLVDLAENAPGLAATFTDVMDEVMSEAGQHGLELSQLLNDSKRLVFGLLRFATSAELRALMDSGMLDPRALRSLGQLATTLVQAGESEPPRVGVLGTLRALGQRDVQRAMGFLLQVAAGFGRALERDATTDAAPKRLQSDARGH